MSAAPIASGAITPAAPGMTVQPMVRTRKKVPINSAIQERRLFIRRCNQIEPDVASHSLAAGVFGITFAQLFSNFLRLRVVARALISRRCFLQSARRDRR